MLRHTSALDSSLLTSKVVWIEVRNIQLSKKDIISSPGVGIDYAQEHHELPWRFRLKNSPWTSKAK